MTINSPFLKLGNFNGVNVNCSVTGTGIPAGARVTKINTTTGVVGGVPAKSIEISVPATETNATATISIGSLGIRFGVLADNEGLPAGLVSSEGLFKGEAHPNTWAGARITGLTTTVSTPYWLAALAEGGSLHFNTALAALATTGTDILMSSVNGYKTIKEITESKEEGLWLGAGEAEKSGPIGFQVVNTAVIVPQMLV